jgi:hypothetical protein
VISIKRSKTPSQGEAPKLPERDQVNAIIMLIDTLLRIACYLVALQEIYIIDLKHNLCNYFDGDKLR